MIKTIKTIDYKGAVSKLNQYESGLGEWFKEEVENRFNFGNDRIISWYIDESFVNEDTYKFDTWEGVLEFFHSCYGDKHSNEYFEEKYKEKYDRYAKVMEVLGEGYNEDDMCFYIDICW